eukprot:6200054-Pleurochrysis_carterae.AAC.2
MTSSSSAAPSTKLRLIPFALLATGKPRGTDVLSSKTVSRHGNGPMYLGFEPSSFLRGGCTGARSYVAYKLCRNTET